MAAHANSQSMSLPEQKENFSTPPRHVCSGDFGCGKGFSGLKTYRNHIEHCSRVIPETCCVCELRVHPKRLRTHLQDTHDMQCGTCNRVFERTDKMIEHVVHCKTSVTACCICALPVPTAQLQSHFEIVHGMQCNRCQRVFDRPLYLEKHVVSCTGGSIPCPFGDLSCRIPINQVNSDAGWNHVRQHLHELVCTFCNQDFSTTKTVSVTGFVLHWNACKERSEKRRQQFSCDRCLEQFETRYLWGKHRMDAFACIPGAELCHQSSWFNVFSRGHGITAALYVETSAFQVPRELYVRIESSGAVEPMSTSCSVAMEFLDGVCDETESNSYFTRLVGLHAIDEGRPEMTPQGMLYALLTTRLVRMLQENLAVFGMTSHDQVFELCDRLLAHASFPLETISSEKESVLRNSARSFDVGNAVLKQECFQNRVVYRARESERTFVVPVQKLLKKIMSNVKKNGCLNHQRCIEKHGQSPNPCARRKELVYQKALPMEVSSGQLEGVKPREIEVRDESYENCVYIWFRDVFSHPGLEHVRTFPTHTSQSPDIRAHFGVTFPKLMSSRVTEGAVEFVGRVLLKNSSRDSHPQAKVLRTLVLDGVAKAIPSQQVLKQLKCEFG